MTSNDLQQFAFKISLQCCDTFKKRESDIFLCFDHLEPRDPAEECIDLLARKAVSREQTNREFLIRAYTDWIIKKYGDGLALEKLEVINRAKYTFTEKSDEGKKVLQYSLSGGAVSVSRQLLLQNLLCRTIAQTNTEQTDIPVSQTRIWPASYLKNLQEFNLIKDKNHPARLMHFTYGLVRDFIYSSYNYSGVFGQGDGELVIDAITRECRFNGEKLTELPVAGKMYKHFYHSGVTRDIDEISSVFNSKAEEGYRRLIKDDILAAELTARTETRTIDTPDELRQAISRPTGSGPEMVNDQSLEQTMDVLAMVRTETDEFQIPFTQVRVWPAQFPQNYFQDNH